MPVCVADSAGSLSLAAGCQDRKSHPRPFNVPVHSLTPKLHSSTVHFCGLQYFQPISNWLFKNTKARCLKLHAVNSFSFFLF